MKTLTPTLAVEPSPCNTRTIITFELPRPQYAALTIHDEDGVLVTVLLANDRAVGKFALVWDGRDSAGRSVPAGAYLVCLSTTARRETQKVAVGPCPGFPFD